MSSQNAKDQRLAEAAGYALLRRLAPMLSHNMAGLLQPLSMVATVLEKRLQNPNPDFATLISKSSHLKSLTREASNACMSLMTWLAPNPNERVGLAAGITDASELVMTELSFKGFSIVNKVGDLHAELPYSLIRMVYIAALLALTDATTAPADVILEAELVDSGVILTISLQPAQRERVLGRLASYRNIEWYDVQALADIHSVTLTHTSECVKLEVR